MQQLSSEWGYFMHTHYIQGIWQRKIRKMLEGYMGDLEQEGQPAVAWWMKCRHGRGTFQGGVVEGKGRGIMMQGVGMNNVDVEVEITKFSDA